MQFNDHWPSRHRGASGRQPEHQPTGMTVEQIGLTNYAIEHISESKLP